MSEKIDFAIKAIRSYRGDDFLRAQHAFAGMTKEEMQTQYGQSGQTRQEILDGYQKHSDECDECMKYITDLEKFYHTNSKEL